MMHYPGSKDRIAKAILFYMLKNRNDRPYVEPFMGGANVMSNVHGDRYGNDVNPYLVALWKALQAGWNPPEFIDEDMFTRIKNNKDSYSQALVGYAGFVCSFNGFWFSGYKGVVTRTRTDTSGNRLQENQQQYSRNHILRQVPTMIGVHLSCGKYYDMEIPDNSIIYCDPPYQDVSRPYIDSAFDSHSFWQWVRCIAQTGSIVFVTEYAAPLDFVPIWKETVKPVGGTLYGQLQPNKLYVHESQLHMVDRTPPHMPTLRLP